MTVVDFCTMIAGTMNRSVAALTSGGVNQIIVAANNAKREAQKLTDFEVLKVSATIMVNLQSGGDLSTAVLAGTSTPVLINRILRGTINFDGDDRPAEIVTRASMFRRFGLRWDEISPWTDWTGSVATFLPTTPLIYRLGTKIYVWPGTINGMTNPAKVTMDVVKWLDDYVYQRQLLINVLTTGSGCVNTGAYTLTEKGTLNDQPCFIFDTYVNAWYSGGGLPTAKQIMIVYYDPIYGKWRYQVSGQMINGNAIYFLQLANIAGVNGLIGGYTEPIIQAGSSTIAYGASTGITTDFFMTECLDWLTLRVLKAMNYFIKDDRRINITANDIATAWSGVQTWNGTQGDNSDSEGITLD